MTQQIEKKPSVTTPETRTYTDDAAVVAFPLGGIGTGNVSLGARGNLRDWEIGHQSNKGNDLPNTFFALRTQVGDGAPIQGLALERAFPGFNYAVLLNVPQESSPRPP